MGKGFRDWRRQPTTAATGRLLERLDRRWALRVIWELRHGALTFRGLQAACGGVSPGVLQGRLHELRALGVIEKVPRLGYRLSVAGEQLGTALEPLAEWAERNSASLHAGE